MHKVLWIGDGPDCPSGFGKATREIVAGLDYRLGGDYEVTVLGINYRGDPSSVPYAVWAAAGDGDAFGVNRIVWMCGMLNPDVIIIQQDGWNIPAYIHHLRRKNADSTPMYPEACNIPVVAVVAVDGKNFQAAWLKGVSYAVFWTQFALDEARKGGYAGPAAVIPLGVDLNIYRPMDRDEARGHLPEQTRDAFIVGNVNRNQPRKRWDLLVRYFMTWVLEKHLSDAYLYLHTAPTGDVGYNVKQLEHYYGVQDRIILATPEIWYGYSEEAMAATYNCFDVNASTTQGEGFGLTTLESMACGTPQIVPDWSALGDWPKGAVWSVPCTSTNIGAPYVNVIGGVADEKKFINALDCLYFDDQSRKVNGRAALTRAQEPQFRWANIGREYALILEKVLGGRVYDELQAVAEGVS